MNKMNVPKFLRIARATVSKHSPEILTGIGIAGMVVTTVLAVRETPKALRLLDDARYEKGSSHLTTTEKAKACWKCYIPAAATGAASIMYLIGASSVNARRNAALAAAYKLSETALTEYRDQVLNEVGEKKEQIIRDKVAESRIKKDPVSNKEVFITEKGGTLCYDVISGRYFKSDIEQIKRAENELNKQMLNDMYVSLNDFYEALGLSSTSIGEELGWNLDSGLIELEFSPQMADDGNPCLAISYRVAPKYEYYKFMR